MDIRRAVSRCVVLTRRLSGLLVRDGARASHEFWWALATGVAVFVITVVRIPEAWDSIWAEDGTRFLTDARNNGIAAFGHFHAGYLHFAPRVGGLLATATPLRWAAFTMTTYAVVVAVLCGVFTEVTTGAHIEARWIRVGLALSVAFLPALGVETLANVSNLQFLLLFSTFWTLLWLPRRPVGQVSGAILVAVTGLSSLLGVVLVPIALLRLTTRRGRPIAAAMLLALGSHLALVLAFSAGRTSEGAGLGSAMRGYGLVLDSHLVGGPFGAPRYPVLTFVAVLGVVAVLAGVLVRAAAHDGYRRIALVGVIAALSMVLFAGETLTNGRGPRYDVVPAFLILSAVAIGVDAARDLCGGWRTVGTAVPVLAVALSVVWSFAPAEFRIDGPHWSQTLAEARRTCASSSAASVSIRVLPTRDGNDWVVTLPCSAARGTGGDDRHSRTTGL